MLNKSVWMDAGINADNTRRYICINEMVEKLGENVIKALQSYHAMTGCDYTTSFTHKRKVRLLTLMINNHNYVHSFTCLGHGSEVSESVISDMGSGVCSMYVKPKLCSVNEARLAIFELKYSTKIGDELDKVK